LLLQISTSYVKLRDRASSDAPGHSWNASIRSGSGYSGNLYRLLDHTGGSPSDNSGHSRNALHHYQL
ncbi:hypothetical protein, partial [Paenibacillus anaericanus]|uniref:hypothetical protein n=1 Tax=Paenibacillus anaericanus TaxID=170367 RepID=UPI001B8762CF